MKFSDLKPGDPGVGRVIDQFPEPTEQLEVGEPVTIVVGTPRLDDHHTHHLPHLHDHVAGQHHDHGQLMPSGNRRHASRWRPSRWLPSPWRARARGVAVT